MNAINQRNHRIYFNNKGVIMDKQAIWWSAFLAGGMASMIVNEFLQYVYRTMKRNKERQSKKGNQYETVILDDGTFGIPDKIHGDDYNKYISGYDIHIRENFEQYIRLHVQEWWDEYENNRRKEIAPLARTICKYVKVEPVRLKGSWSTDWYAYVVHGAFKVKVRYIEPYFDEQYNMEIKITNTNITENNNEL
jgi:hypothetical protein